MKLPNQAQAILRQSTPEVAAPKGIGAADAACLRRCSQLDPIAAEICRSACMTS